MFSDLAHKRIRAHPPFGELVMSSFPLAVDKTIKGDFTIKSIAFLMSVDDFFLPLQDVVLHTTLAIALG